MPIRTGTEKARELLKEYVCSAIKAIEEDDLPFFEEPVLVSPDSIRYLFDMTRKHRKCIAADELGYIEFDYKDLEDDLEDAIIVNAKDRNGGPLGTLKFIAA